MSALNILSGGAAQGLVGSLADKFKELTGLSIAGDFGAVGAMASKLREGAPADILVLTATLIADLVREGRVDGASVADVGRVETAVAVRAGDAAISVHDAASLRQALLNADAIFAPDIKASTAGIHIAKVLQQLGIAEEVADRLRIYPNGATAMRHLAESDARKPIGATQVTEILATKCVKLSGALPKGCDLATVYTAAVTAKAVHAREAKVLIDLLTGADQRALRERAGFLPI
jgi:molybdate transport system substrate-binding protein